MNNSYPSDQNHLSSVSNAQSSQPESPPSTEEGVIGSRRRLPAGTELSERRYRIERLVASGGMGAVYRAIDTRFNRPCAVKEMLDEFQEEKDRTQAVEWFSREATLLLELNHSCIPRVRDFFVESGRHYLVMDFIDGRTLSEVLDKEGHVVGNNGAHGVTEARARNWAQQLCSVLNYLHTQAPPVIFRDLKPSNVMITGRDEIKLIDFGIARSFQSQRQSTIIMTLGYAPPEQLHGSPEPRSDIYSLGATLYRVLTAHDAANNKPSIFSFPLLRQLRPDITPAFEGIIMRSLAYGPDQRWQTCRAMEDAIRVLPPVTIAPPMRREPPSGGPSTGGNQGNLVGSSVGQGPHSGPGVSLPGQAGIATPTSGTTGPAGSYITAALGHLAAGRIEPAYTAITQACALEDNNALVHKIFGQVFARRRPPQIDFALQAYNRSLGINPNDAETHKLIGDIWLYLRPQHAQAIAPYRKSIELNGQDPETHFRLGQCYEKTGQLELALHEYDEAFKLAQASRQSQQMVTFFARALGNLAMHLRRYELAEASLVQVLVSNPADHNIRFLLAQAYENENKLNDAWRECNYILNPLGANPAVQQMYQRLRMRLGR